MNDPSYIQQPTEIERLRDVLFDVVLEIGIHKYDGYAELTGNEPANDPRLETARAIEATVRAIEADVMRIAKRLGVVPVWVPSISTTDEVAF